MTPELQQIVGILIGVLAVASGTLISLLNARKAEAALEQARAEAEMARLQRELAQMAAMDATTAKGEIVALGAALGASFERSSGAPPSTD